MATRTIDREDWEEKARLLRVMAHPVRLAILEALGEKAWCVKDLNTIAPIPQPHLSQHMSALKKAGLVASHKDGVLRCYYLIRPTLVTSLIALLREEHPEKRRPREEVQKEARGT